MADLMNNSRLIMKGEDRLKALQDKMAPKEDLRSKAREYKTARDAIIKAEDKVLNELLLKGETSYRCDHFHSLGADLYAMKKSISFE